MQQTQEGRRLSATILWVTSSVGISARSGWPWPAARSRGRIGTVDKFQGQEAPIVIYSMTTSTHADAPRGMNFLYSLNRLNVATSRAKCVSILVCSPALFEPECRTPEQMRMANAFCRSLEMTDTLTA